VDEAVPRVRPGLPRDLRSGEARALPPTWGGPRRAEHRTYRPYTSYQTPLCRYFNTDIGPISGSLRFRNDSAVDRDRSRDRRPHSDATRDAAEKVQPTTPANRHGQRNGSGPLLYSPPITGQPRGSPVIKSVEASLADTTGLLGEERHEARQTPYFENVKVRINLR